MAPEWQAAMEALILVATLGGPTMFARIGIMRALNRHIERVFNPDRKEHHWGRHKLGWFKIACSLSKAVGQIELRQEPTTGRRKSREEGFENSSTQWTSR